MRVLVLSPAAQADLDGIWDYTVERWGTEQAARYLTDIRDACHGLAAGTRPSQPSDIRPGYHRCRCGSHVRYFRVADSGRITVVRILHERMDVGRHL
jgi:toxin ParE1/3/4